jgi:hypothetical protein
MSLPSLQGTNYGNKDEVRRITSLPISSGLTPEQVEYIESVMLTSKARMGGKHLLYTQACAINEYLLAGGLFGPIGVGYGKTGISLMIANIAFTRLENPIKKILLLVPPRLEHQLLKVDLKTWREMTPLQYGVIDIIGKGAELRKRLARSGRQGLYIMSYSQLQIKDGEDRIHDINPGMIIADEAHNISGSKRSARSRRVFDYLRKYPKTETVFLSGTLSNKSIIEYHDAAKFSLKDNCFLPLNSSLTKEWVKCIDAQATKEGNFTLPSGSAALMRPLIEWYRQQTGIQVENTPVGYREAYNHRLMTCPGVHSTGDASIPTSLMICNTELRTHDFEDYPGFQTLKAHCKKVEDEMITPAGEDRKSVV